jgi:hypothetical protein
MDCSVGRALRAPFDSATRTVLKFRPDLWRHAVSAGLFDWQRDDGHRPSLQRLLKPIPHSRRSQTAATVQSQTRTGMCGQVEEPRERGTTNGGGTGPPEGGTPCPGTAAQGSLRLPDFRVALAFAQEGLLEQAAVFVFRMPPAHVLNYPQCVPGAAGALEIKRV